MYDSNLARKITTTLFAAQSLGSAGFIAVATVSAIVGANLSGNAALAGMPSAVYGVGAALAALGLGYLMDKFGRQGGINLGLMLGVVGAGLSVASITSSSFPLFLVGMMLMGVAQAGLQLSRFAAAEVHSPAERGRAISNVVIGGAVGAIVGPLLVGPTGKWAQEIGMTELAGPFLLALLLFLVAGIVVFIFLRPDPKEIGKKVAEIFPVEVDQDKPKRPLFQIFRQPGPLVALSAMVFAQLVMVLLMVITSLHLKQNQHMLSDISLVISSHTLGMYAFSFISGRLADRWGREAVILIGAGTLVLACLTAPLSPDVFPLAVALFLLGLGWNFCYVGGSSLLSDHLQPQERSTAQGFNDLVIGLVSAAGSMTSGLIFAALGYTLVGVISALFALVPIAMVLWLVITRRRVPADSRIETE